MALICKPTSNMSKSRWYKMVLKLLPCLFPCGQNLFVCLQAYFVLITGLYRVCGDRRVVCSATFLACEKIVQTFLPRMLS